MNKRFRSYIESLELSLRRLQRMKPVKLSTLPRDLPAAGVYLFSEGRRHLYLGRSNRLRSRFQRHGRESGRHHSATFAFRLARETTGWKKATYRPEGSRESLQANPNFNAAFNKAKARIRRMDVRFVEESLPLQQALLEIYVAVALGTRHNDFDTH